MADNLESYFKKHLSDEIQGEGNWNVPADDVWNKVSLVIAKKSGLFISWTYMYIAGALLLAALAIIFWPGVTSQLISDSDIQINSENNEASIEENSNTTANYPAQAAAVVENQAAQIKNYTTQENTTTLIQSATEISDLPIKSDNIKYTSVLSTLSSRKDIFIGTLPQRSINSIAIPFYRNTPDTIPAKYPRISFQDQKPKPFNNKNKIAIGAYFVPSYNNTSVSGELSSGDIETANTYLYSNNWGFELKYYISNRFTLVAGFERSEIKSWSKSFIDFDYDASTEHTMPEGDIENTSPVPMQTPFGEVDTEITYRFSSEQSITDGETMQSVMETHQEVLYFSIPLGIEYNFMQFSRLNWFGEGGLRYNRALNDGTSYTTRILHEGHDMNVLSEEMTGHPNYKKNYFGFYVGTGANYQFSESFQISGSARYFGNITKVNVQDNLSTYLHGFNLKLGIIYIF